MEQHAQDDLLTHYQPGTCLLRNPDAEDKIITLLLEQIQLLLDIDRNLARSMEKQTETRYILRTRILDVDMSIGAMIRFMLKWVIASIPVGIAIGLVWLLITILTH